MRRSLSILFALFAGVVIAIGLGIFLTGPDTTARFFNAMLRGLFEHPFYEGGLDGSNTGSEMRFFSVFWIAFGVMMAMFSRDILKHRTGLIWLMVIFFMGGVGRVLAHNSSGTPDTLFVVLGWIELTLPIALGAALIFGVKPKA